MIWLTWRQHRKQALFAVIGLAVLAAVLIPTGLQMYDGLAETGLAACRRELGQAELVDLRAVSRCEETAAAFSRRYESRDALVGLLVFLPLLAGLFWGATLVSREVEPGTHRLVWTQGVTRLRWLLVKGGLVIAAVTIVATVYALLASWWVTPLVASGFASRLQFPFFDVSGLAPVGYFLFAVALGGFAGAVSRKVLPAMAITLVGFVAARVALAGIRLRFQAPLELRVPVVTDVWPNPLRDDLVLSERVYRDDGTLLEREGTVICEPPPPDFQPPADGPVDLGCSGYNAITYLPGSRFWPLQYLETGIVAGLILLLVLLAAYQVRRRIS